jgi:hypothetical protein
LARSWLKENRILDVESGSYRLVETIEREILSEIQAAYLEPSFEKVVFIDNLLSAFLLPALSENDLRQPPTEDNYVSWFFQNYGILLDRPADTEPVFQALYLAIQKSIEEEHPFVGGFILSVFNLPGRALDGSSTNIAAAWLPQMNRMIFPVYGSSDGADADFFMRFLHEYSHFLDCCVVGENQILGENSTEAGEMTYFSANHANQLGFSLSPLDDRYIQSSLPGAHNRWWRNRMYYTSREQQYKDHSPSECLAEMYSSYFGCGRDESHLQAFSQPEKEWFLTDFLKATKAAIEGLALTPVLS